MEKRTLNEIYGENCFSENLMKQRLPKSVFEYLKEVQKGQRKLDLQTAEVIAGAMKDWALEKGATHYTHWFQPLTEATAEKHDSFIWPMEDGSVVLAFSGKELIQGEPDASSFPNGGLRATFEARGYTAWDTTSPAFLKQDKTGLTLTIPTAFVSYTGEALDKKVPLLRSMDAINNQALRLLKILGNTTTQRVISNIGPEQEYFLVSKEYYSQRPDLQLTGRTVFGSMAAKGQEMDDHYFGPIKDRVAEFMRLVNVELWKIGISAKTQHNEVAPNQFELATIFSSSNVACDTNQIVMEILKKTAEKLDMVCLLHEKPFAGVNGSGKHNNWSLNTDDGLNLLKPGNNPQDNAQFLLFLTATIAAVDEYAELLRMSASNAGNDHRLGANEAPPAIISIFLGDQLFDIMEKLGADKPVSSREGGVLNIGANCLPVLPLDTTDRNRTSPFAFTGNKFEFRMVGSAQSIAGSNVVLNTAVAEILSRFCTRLEKAKELNKEIKTLIKESYNNHKRVVFNGNGYSDEWVKEAKKRRLPNIRTTVEALKELTSSKSIDLFNKHNILTKAELESRYEIYQEKYSQQINIEAAIMLEMAEKQIIPAVMTYIEEVTSSALNLVDFLPDADLSMQREIAGKLNENLNALYRELKTLKTVLKKAQGAGEEATYQADLYASEVIPAMEKVRQYGDELEQITGRENWPFPGYEDLLFKL